MKTTILPAVTLYECCPCCPPGHLMRHADPCGRHQGALAREAKRRRRG